MLWSAFGLALGAIRRNGVRSVLTALGVVIGVASVIIMVDLGESATQNVSNQIAAMGPNLLFVKSGVGRRGPGGARGEADPLESADARAIERQIPAVVVAPAASTQSTLVYRNVNASASVVGTTEAYLTARNRAIEDGRTFTAQELESAAPVCILGVTIVENLFDGEEPLGAKIRVGRLSCLVIGVLEEKGESMGQDQDELVLMPLTAVQRRLVGNDELSDIYVSAASADDTTPVKEALEALMRRRRGVSPNEDDDFHVRDMQELASMLQGTTSTLTTLLAAIAAVSLVVGGIGIMNIMLVSVTERTREIGLRIAIGALASDVLVQFLVEAIVLSILGGLVGIVLGVAGSIAVLNEMEMPVVVSWNAVAGSFFVSAAIGTAFGYIPARKAAHLDPIDALRHE